MSKSATDAFTQRLFDFLDVFEYRRTDAEEDREAIYRLRYEAYRRDGNVSNGFTADSGDFFDQSANCHVFGLYIAGTLVSSIRVNICSPENRISPTMSIFPDILNPMVDRGMVFVDPSRFVVDRNAARGNPELIYATMRLVTMAAVYFDADYCLATVRPEHNAFYRKVFQVKVMSRPRLFPSLSQPVNMLGGLMDDVAAKVVARYPIFDSNYLEQRMLFNAGHWPTLPARHVSLPEILTADPHHGAETPNFAGMQ